MICKIEMVPLGDRLLLLIWQIYHLSCILQLVTSYCKCVWKMEGSNDISRNIHHVLSVHTIMRKNYPERIFSKDLFYKCMLLYRASGPYFSNKVTINLHYFQENKVDKPKLLIIYVMPCRSCPCTMYSVL